LDPFEIAVSPFAETYVVPACDGIACIAAQKGSLGPSVAGVEEEISFVDLG
jgi:hypothetical protein